MALFPVPLPYLLGALASSALAVAILPAARLHGFAFPDSIRMPFISIIGLLIGSQVHIEAITNWRSVGALMLAVTLFTPLAFRINFLVLRGFGKYDTTTAIFAAAPGGLIEAMTLGEKAGADVALLTVQQFLRIILVVTLIPLAISVWVGHPVGSAAGMGQLSSGPTSPIWLIALVGIVGAVLGKLLRLPAAPMIGPMVIAGAITSTGVVELSLPGWLVIVAQVVIGTALGLRFNGMSARVLRRGIGLGVVTVSLMLLVGAVLTLALVQLPGLSASASLLSLAPGGVTEMALVALSLAADPALVTLAHVYRISLTVMLMLIADHRLSRQPSLRD